MARGAKLPDNKVQEHHNDLAGFLTQAINRAFLAQIQGVDAQTHNNGNEHNGKHGIVNTEGSANVAGNDIQNDQQRIGTGSAGSSAQAFHLHMEQTHVKTYKRDRAGQCQSNGSGHHEPANGLAGNTAQSSGLIDLADGHNHRGEHHGNNDQLQSANKHLTADIEQTQCAFTAGGGDVLEQNVLSVDHRALLAPTFSRIAINPSPTRIPETIAASIRVASLLLLFSFFIDFDPFHNSFQTYTVYPLSTQKAIFY